MSNECCGANFRPNNISFVAVLTLSFPLMILSCVALIITVFSAKARKLFRALIRINSTVIRDYQLFPKLKCRTSSSLYAVSPLLSGLVFKYFNLSFVVFVWMVIISFFGVLWLWH